MLGYIAGAVDLVGWTGGFIGGTQFAVLSVFAATSILGCCALTCWAVTERVLISTGHEGTKQGSFRFVRQIVHKLLHLPPRIQAICWAQFWAWIGWFPFLFYNTTWVGETYFRYEAPEEARKSKDILGDMGRIGSTSLVIYSTITFTGAWLLPLLVTSPENEGQPPVRDDGSIMGRLRKYRPNLLTTWMIGHGLFAAAMFLAPFARSYGFATFLLCICGLYVFLGGFRFV
jgi:solute carrier family 45, member 1/2/4